VELQLSRSALRSLIRLPAFAGVSRVAAGLRWTSRTADRILVVGTSGYEPWHLVAHLQSCPVLASSAPALVRWPPPAGAPAHLSIGVDQITSATRDQAVLVVASGTVEEELMQRLADARHGGATVLTLAGTGTGTELADLSHEFAAVPSPQLDYAQHLLPAAAGTASLRRLGG
jgi:hypothetical protein